MTDKDYIQLLEKLRRELHRRYGKKVCSELDLSCVSCQVNVVIGAINNLVDTVRFAERFKKISVKSYGRLIYSGKNIRVCENGHTMSGIGSDLCPECDAPWRKWKKR